MPENAADFHRVRASRFRAAREEPRSYHPLTVRLAFVHEASLHLEPDADPRAPGAAVTMGLCGHWRHEGPCRWPHLNAASALAGRRMTLRVLFVAEPEDEPEIRLRIARALRSGRLDGPGGPSGWNVLRDGASEVLPEDRPALDRLLSA